MKKQFKIFKNYLKSKEILIILFILSVLLLSVFISSFWGTLRFNEGYVSNLYFEEYDNVISPESDFCFTAIISTDKIVNHSGIFNVLINNKTVFGKPLALKSEVDFFGNHYGFLKKELCFPSSLLDNGDNIVKVNFASESIFFHIEKKFTKSTKYDIKVLDLNEDGLLFETSFENLNTFKPIYLFVNGELNNKIYPYNGKDVYFEKIDYENGNNLVLLKFDDFSIEKNFYFKEDVSSNLIIGSLILIFAFIVTILFVFSQYELYQKIMLSFVTIFSLIIFNGFILNITNTLSLLSFLILFLIEISTLLILFRKNFSFSSFKLKDLKFLKNPILFIVIFGAILLPLIFNVFTVSGYSYWNVYYERQASSLIEDFSLSQFDELSYLGRDLGFIPGYFFLEAGFSWITGLSGEALFAFLIVTANLFFLFTLFSFGKKIGLSNTKVALFYAFLWTENFIRGALIVSPRHAFSLGLFIAALTLILMNRKRIFSGISLGIAAFIQAPLLLAFPFMYIIVSKKIDWKKLLWVLIIAGFIFGGMVLPNLINAGALTQADKSSWGYLINYDVLNIFLDIGPIIVFFLLFTLWDVLKKNIEWTPYTKKLLIASVAGILFQIFVSYRWNIFNAINIVLLIVILIPKKAIQNKYFVRIFAILLLLVGFLTVMGIGMLSITNYQINAYNYLEENSSFQQNILTDPLFGHNITYFSERKVLADLAVEYAPEEKLFATYSFLQDKNYSVLEEYDIDFVLNQSYMVNRKAFGNKRLDEPLEFEKLDKVFANNLIYIHRVPKELK